MRFEHGIVVFFLVVFAANAVMYTLASGLNDPLVPSYEAEAR